MHELFRLRMTKGLTNDQLERLSFAKYLLTLAGLHKDKGKPLSSFSVLALHDLMEIYLQVAVEVLAPESKKTGQKILETLTDIVNENLRGQAGAELISRFFIKRLNELRNQLKHASIFIEKSTIQTIFSETQSFLNDFTPLIFDREFGSISQLLLIKHQEIRQHLEDAERFIATEKFSNAIISITKAYHYLEHLDLNVHEDGYTRDRHRVTPFDTNLQWRSRATAAPAPDHNLLHFAKEVTKDLTRINRTVVDLERAVAFGINYKSFLQFRHKLPHIYVPSTGDRGRKLHFSNVSEHDIQKLNVSPDSVIFCFQLIVDMVFNLQES